MKKKKRKFKKMKTYPSSKFSVEKLRLDHNDRKVLHYKMHGKP